MKAQYRNGTDTIRWWSSPACVRIMEHLACKGPSTYQEIGKACFVATGYCYNLLSRILVPAKVVHLPAWRINARGPASPLYAIGPGMNKRRPAPETAAQRNKRRRDSMLELYGSEITNKVLNASRTTHIVLGGERIRPGSHQSHIAGQWVGKPGKARSQRKDSHDAL